MPLTSGTTLLGNVGLTSQSYDYIVYGDIPNDWDARDWKSACDDFVRRSEEMKLLNVLQSGSSLLCYFLVRFIECDDNRYGIAISFNIRDDYKYRNYIIDKLRTSKFRIRPYVIQNPDVNHWKLEYFTITVP